MKKTILSTCFVFACISNADYVAIVAENSNFILDTNAIVGESYGDWSSWSENGEHTNCGLWSPEPSTQTYGVSYEQTRTCDVEEIRTRDVFAVYEDGTTKANGIETETQTGTATEQQQAVGTMNVVVGTREGEWSAYSAYNAPTNCATFNPTTTSISSYPSYEYVSHAGSLFTFKQECDQKYVRTRTIYNIMSDGSETVNNIEEDYLDGTIDKMTVKNAKDEYVFARNNTYVMVHQDGNYWQINVYFEDWDSRVWGTYTYGYSNAIAKLNAAGYQLGQVMSGTKNYSFKVTNADPIPIWQYTSSVSVSSCSGYTQGEYWDYTGEICSSEGSTMTVCGDVGGAGNNPNWANVTLTCEK